MPNLISTRLSEKSSKLKLISYLFKDKKPFKFKKDLNYSELKLKPTKENIKKTYLSDMKVTSPLNKSKTNIQLSTNTTKKLWKWKKKPENTTNSKNCSILKSNNTENLNNVTMTLKT